MTKEAEALAAAHAEADHWRQKFGAVERRFADLKRSANDFFKLIDVGPEKDRWETDTGKEEPGARKYVSFRAREDYRKRLEKADNELRSMLRIELEPNGFASKSRVE